MDHTWAEGVQACKDVTVSVSVKSPIEFTHRRVRSDTYPPGADAPSNVTKQVNYISLVGISNGGDSGYKDCAGLARVFWCVLLGLS